MYATAYNRTDAPVVIDAEGRSIEGGGFGTVDTLADEVKSLAEAGHLHIFPSLEAGPGQSDAAADAIERTAIVRERAAGLSTVDKDDLVKMAGDAGVSTPNALDKADLITRIAFRPEFDIEAAVAKAKDRQAKEEKKKAAAATKAAAGASTPAEKPDSEEA